MSAESYGKELRTSKGQNLLGPGLNGALGGERFRTPQMRIELHSQEAKQSKVEANVITSCNINLAVSKYTKKVDK